MTGSLLELMAQTVFLRVGSDREGGLGLNLFLCEIYFFLEQSFQLLIKFNVLFSSGVIVLSEG